MPTSSLKTTPPLKRGANVLSLDYRAGALNRPTSLWRCTLGQYEFYTGDNGTGTRFYLVSDKPGQNINLHDIGKQDSARSVALSWVVPGVLKLYDHGEAKVVDDWCEIEIFKQVEWCLISTFDRNYTDPNGVYRQTWHKSNGLAGRVSYLRTTVAPPLKLDYDALGKYFGSWNDTNGLAAKFYSQGSDYRIYQPETSPLLDASGAKTGTLIYTQIDNIRGGNDDHCHLKIEVLLDGTFSTELKFEWGSAPLAVKIVAKVAGWIARKVIDLAGSWPQSQLMATYSTILNESSQAFRQNPEGRVNFNAAVAHCINKIVQCTRD